MSENPLRDLIAFLNTLPNEVNPYPVFAQETKARGLVTFPSYFDGIAWACTAMAAFGILLALASVGIKTYNGGLWICTTRATPKGRLWVPNTSLLVLLACLLFFTSSIATLHFLLKGFREGQNIYAAIFTQGLPWACLVILAWLQLWSMSVSVYLYYAPRTAYWSAKIFKPMWLNLGAVLFLPLQLASTIAVFGVSAQRANAAFTSFEDFRDQMASLGADWSYGEPFILLGPPYFSSLNTYFARLEDAFLWISKAFIVHSVYLCFTLALALPIGYLYGRMLKHQIKRLTLAGTIKSGTKAAGPDYSHLKQMYRLLAIEAIVVVALALLYIGLALWIAIDRHSALTNGYNLSFIFTISFLCGILSQLVICGIILFRTITSIRERKRNASGHAISKGVHIKTEVHVEASDAITTEVEDGDFEPWMFSISDCPDSHSMGDMKDEEDNIRGDSSTINTEEKS